MARLSGLQKDVLSLYRQCLRAVRQKPKVRRNHISETLLDLNSSNTPISARRTLGLLSTGYGEDGPSSKRILILGNGKKCGRRIGNDDERLELLRPKILLERRWGACFSDKNATVDP
ncbi:hypothetical protein IQ07DRAFT_359082 [Pyrenochaeta sp. DS3sAY3a]|nr:hypothetical protein IQ07DRAFT_359082 [Pyrenochaeta sp. DS3sAY3a]